MMDDPALEHELDKEEAIEEANDSPRTDTQGILRLFHQYSQEQYKSVEPGIKGAIIGILNQLSGGNLMRYSLLLRLFPGKWPNVNAVSTKDLSDGEWYALERWIIPGKATPTSSWAGHPALKKEIETMMSFPNEPHQIGEVDA